MPSTESARSRSSFPRPRSGCRTASRPSSSPASSSPSSATIIMATTRRVVCVQVSSLDEQAMLMEADPGTYSKPAYLPGLGLDQSCRRRRRLGPCRRPDRGKLGACGAAPLAGSWRTMSECRNTRRRWITLRRIHRARRADRLRGSACGSAWKEQRRDKPTPGRRAAAGRSRSTLRGKAQDDGPALDDRAGRGQPCAGVADA